MSDVGQDDLLDSPASETRDVLEDYLANSLQAGELDSDGDEEVLQGLVAFMMGRNSGDTPAFVREALHADLADPRGAEGGWTAGLDDSGDSSTSSEEGSGDTSSSSGAGEEEDAGSLAGVLTQEELEQLTPAQRFPVGGTAQSWFAKGLGPRGGSGSQHPGSRPAKAGGKKKGVTQLPGYKTASNKETVEAKRAARSLARGFDLAALDATFRDFVESGSDMTVLAAMKPGELRQASALAAAYGLRLGGDRRRPSLATTPRAGLPRGVAVTRVQLMLARWARRGEHGAAVLAGEGKGGEPVQVRGQGPGPGPAQGPRVSGPRRETLVTMHREGVRLGRGKAGAREAVEALVDGVAIGSKARGPRQLPAQPSGSAPSPAIRFISGGVIAGDATPVLAPPRQAAVDQAGTEPRRLVLDSRDASLSTTVPTLLEVLDDRDPGGGDASTMQYHITARGLALRRAEAAGGLTSPMRQLSLGMALGAGPDVFRATGADDDQGPAADLSPLVPAPTRKQAKKELRRAARAARSGASTTAAEGGTREQAAAVHGEYGDFERHTTGIGSKLMSKWGFGGKGMGLGPDGAGRAEPVEALRRAKKLGLGADWD